MAPEDLEVLVAAVFVDARTIVESMRRSLDQAESSIKVFRYIEDHAELEDA